MHIRTIDAHVAGAAVRLVTSGLPGARGGSLDERAAAFAEDAGRPITSLGREPRGHDGTVVALFAEPDRQEADAALLFFGAHGGIPLCGHGLMGATALGLWRHLIVPRRADLVVLDTLSGAVTWRGMRDASSSPI